MKLLILGGTKFLGRHLVEAASARGHDITLFNRGMTHPDLYPEVEHLQGDRDGQLDALAGRTWDAVIDTCGYVPRIVRQSVEMLKSATDHYTFISSISVYDNFVKVGMDEDEPVGKLEDAQVGTEDIHQFYGQLKALCEAEVQSTFGLRSLVVRPGLIVGPHDPTDRYTYWVRRFFQGGDILLPAPSDYRIQFIDARDLAEWTLQLVERRVCGVFNATGPDDVLTLDDFVEALQTASPTDSRAVWVDEAFLVEEGVQEWMEIPLWISSKAEWPGFSAVNIDRALAEGLTFRTLHDTIGATADWDATRGATTALKAGLSAEREAELLRKFADLTQ